MGKTKDVDLLANHFESKPKNKKTKQGSNMKTVIATVFVTLAVVAAFTATFFYGVNHEASKQNQIESRIEAAVKEVETSKN